MSYFLLLFSLQAMSQNVDTQFLPCNRKNTKIASHRQTKRRHFAVFFVKNQTDSDQAYLYNNPKNALSALSIFHILV